MKFSLPGLAGLLLIASGCAPHEVVKKEAPPLTVERAATIDDMLAAVKTAPGQPLEARHWTEVRTAADAKAQSAYHAGIAALYLQQVKKSLIDHKNHGGWPIRSFLLTGKYAREQLAEALRVELAAHPSPLIKYALICPALYTNNDELARRLLDELKAEDAFLYERASQLIDTVWIPYIQKQADDAG